MKYLKPFASFVKALVILAIPIGLIWWGVSSLFRHIISELPKGLGAPIIAAVATVLVSTITVMVGRYYERKKELDALYRDKKIEIYDEFLKEFFSLTFNAGEDGSKDVQKDLVPFFREFIRKLILWSGPEVIEAFLAWKDHLAKGVPDAQTIFLTEAFVLAIRKDLRQSNRGLRKGFYARISLKMGDLFLEMAEKNPNITLAELAELENKIQNQLQQNSSS